MPHAVLVALCMHLYEVGNLYDQCGIINRKLMRRSVKLSLYCIIGVKNVRIYQTMSYTAVVKKLHRHGSYLGCDLLMAVTVKTHSYGGM